jgi:hypothetical protein
VSLLEEFAANESDLYKECVTMWKKCFAEFKR